MTKLLYQRILVVLLALIVVFGGWFAADWQLRRAEAAANWTDQKQVLILDAGHGGEDGGAVAPNGTVEADVNLQIALRARAIAELTGIEVIMTRDSPDIAYPDDATTIAERKKADQHQRAELIRRTDNAVLISIHQNCYPDRKPSGAQVLYAASPGSDTIGALMHDNLVAYLDPQNRRVAVPISEKIYLMREVNCPAVLVECGFLSNESECAKLEDGGYQTKLAAVIIASYLQYRQSLPQTGMVI
ncbi:MAG: N-acetylmuramoyl-L-alanine amidase [Oscillospiraceae bacterium]